MNIDTGLSPTENVISLINHDNDINLTSVGVSLGLPVQYVDPEGINTRNTELVVTGNTGNGYTDTVSVRYTRLDLNVLKGTLTLSYTMTDTSTLETVINSIATQMNIVNSGLEMFIDTGNGFLKVDDLSSLSITTPRNCELRAATNAYLYVGSASFTIEPDPNA